LLNLFELYDDARTCQSQTINLLLYSSFHTHASQPCVTAGLMILQCYYMHHLLYKLIHDFTQKQQLFRHSESTVFRYNDMSECSLCGSN